jgi:hypothetical protein
MASANAQGHETISTAVNTFIAVLKLTGIQKAADAKASANTATVKYLLILFENVCNLLSSVFVNVSLFQS